MHARWTYACAHVFDSHFSTRQLRQLLCLQFFHQTNARTASFHSSLLETHPDLFNFFCQSQNKLKKSSLVLQSYKLPPKTRAWISRVFIGRENMAQVRTRPKSGRLALQKTFLLWQSKKKSQNNTHQNKIFFDRSAPPLVLACFRMIACRRTAVRPAELIRVWLQRASIYPQNISLPPQVRVSISSNDNRLSKLTHLDKMALFGATPLWRHSSDQQQTATFFASAVVRSLPK